MSTIGRNAVFALVTALIVGPARADQYWVAYEGNDFPENEGWERHYSMEYPDERSISNGSLVLDGSANERTFDFYQVHRTLNPDAGEVFIAEWNLRVTVISSPFEIGDTGFTIARDGRGTLNFSYLDNQISSTREGWSIEIEPGVFHSYRLTSADMIHYSLFIDGAFAREGQWDLNSLNESFVGFGDESLGAGVRSISEWDYMRFGVIPEPTSAAYALILMVCFTRKGIRNETNRVFGARQRSGGDRFRSNSPVEHGN